MGFAEKLYDLRQKAKLSQKELAQKLGVAQASINYWEKQQRTPSVTMVALIADFFNVSIDYLMGTDKIIQQSQNILNDFSNHPENWVQENPLTEEKIPVKQMQLLRHYNELNELGKNKAIERIKELSEIPRYTKSNELLKPKAAHNDHINEPEELEKMQEDLKMLEKYNK